MVSFKHESQKYCLLNIINSKQPFLLELRDFPQKSLYLTVDLQYGGLGTIAEKIVLTNFVFFKT